MASHSKINQGVALSDADVRIATEILNRYRAGKSRMDSRISGELLWWQNRYGVDGTAEPVGRADGQKGAKPTSAWLFSSICNKHADMCDATPTCVALPREPDDEAEAAMLSDILPIIAERSHFHETYSSNVWSKLMHGVAAYGIFWNPSLENGVGDIDIRHVDVMNIFWEPGVRNIQESPNLFLVGLEDSASLMMRYPLLRERRAAVRDDSTLLSPELGGSYLACGSDGIGDKIAVVDWYYKRTLPTGKTVLHFAKFAGDVLLYASENDPALRDRGWYDHGQYPIVLDILYPEAGTPSGYGLIAVGRNPQGYIDELDGHMLEYANHASRVRYWAKRSLGVNEKDFLNPDKRIVEVEGDIDDEKLRQITLSPMDPTLGELRLMKITEIKETTGNRDVSQGSASDGVTAAAAITALQEAGNKGSRDMIAGSYRAYIQIMQQVIELIRQFYDGVRCFRITGKDGGRRYVRYTHKGLQDQASGIGSDGERLYRHPVFDIEVRAERETPLNRTGRNELMLELFRAGFFDADRADAAGKALRYMDFDGVDSLRTTVEYGKVSSEITV